MNLQLDYKEFEKHLISISQAVNADIYGDGVFYRFRFDNGFGASVVKHAFSHGHENDLWELAVIKFDDNGDFSLVYDTPITDDVLGHLDDKSVREYLQRIKDLPSVSE